MENFCAHKAGACIASTVLAILLLVGCSFPGGFISSYSTTGQSCAYTIAQTGHPIRLSGKTTLTASWGVVQIRNEVECDDKNDFSGFISYTHNYAGELWCNGQLIVALTDIFYRTFIILVDKGGNCVPQPAGGGWFMVNIDRPDDGFITMSPTEGYCRPCDSLKLATLKLGPIICR